MPSLDGGRKLLRDWHCPRLGCDRQFVGNRCLRRRFVGLVSLLMTLALAATVVWLSDVHSWSSEATAWALTAVLGGSTAIDLAVSRWWERSSWRQRRDRFSPHHMK